MQILNDVIASENHADHIVEDIFPNEGEDRTVLSLDAEKHLASTTSEDIAELQAEAADLHIHGTSETDSGQVSEDSALIDNGHDDSGEFVVAMLARGKLEEQGVGLKGTSSPLSETGTALGASYHRDEDVTTESWRQHRKHVFVLSEAGKPIYSRYGSEEALSSTMGVMMALVSFVQSGDNVIRSVYSGKGLVHFLVFNYIV